MKFRYEKIEPPHNPFKFSKPLQWFWFLAFCIMSSGFVGLIFLGMIQSQTKAWRGIGWTLVFIHFPISLVIWYNVLI